jgi:peptidoglycan hydrolase CwlO-like protein
VPEDPIADGEMAALTRRFEDVADRTDREFGIVKSDLTALRLQVGNLDQKAGNLDARVGELVGEVRDLRQTMERNQAQIVELLTQLVGRSTDGD